MGRIKRIFFDLGLTLVENDAPLRYADILTGLGKPVTEQQAKTAYHLANKYFMREEPGRLGAGTEQVLADFLRRLCGFLEADALSGELFRQLRAEGGRSWRCFPFTLATLDALRAEGYRLGLISNWDPSCREVLRATGLDTRLDPVVVSCEAGVEKPDPQIFQKALALSGEKPEECLYVGDNYYDDGVGATAVGMSFCILNPPERLGIEELELSFVAEDIRAFRELLHDGCFETEKSRLAL